MEEVVTDGESATVNQRFKFYQTKNTKLNIKLNTHSEEWKRLSPATVNQGSKFYTYMNMMGVSPRGGHSSAVSEVLCFFFFFSLLLCFFFRPSSLVSMVGFFFFLLLFFLLWPRLHFVRGSLCLYLYVCTRRGEI